MRKCILPAACVGLIVVIGCTQETKTTTATSRPASGVDGSQFLLASEPVDASGVIQARESAQDQDEVVIMGRIGGSVKPWVEGRAAFSIVDVSLKSCAECGSDDCPKPWDYC